MKQWIKLCVAAIGLLVVGSAHAEDRAITLDDEVAKLIDQPNGGETTTDKLTSELATCSKNNAVCVRALQSIWPKCGQKCTVEEYLKNDAKCPEVPAPSTSSVSSSSGLTATAPVVRHPTTVHVKICRAPAKVLNGVCVCPDETLNTDIGKSPNGDVVTVDPIGKTDGACVPSFEAAKRTVERDNRIFRLICRIDSVEMTEKEKAWLKNLGIDPDRHVEDGLCERTSDHLMFLITYFENLAKDQDLTPGDKAKKADSPAVRDEAEPVARFVQKLSNHERRIGELEKKGTRFQALGTAFYNGRFQGPDTLGLRLDANIIHKFSHSDGVMFGMGFGYGKYGSFSKEAAWRASIEWYHVFNAGTISSDEETSTSEETTETSASKRTDSESARLDGAIKIKSSEVFNPSTLYAMHLGPCLTGGWLVKNVQDEMQGGLCAGFQIVPKSFVIDFGVMLGYGRHGMYVMDNRIGYSPYHLMIGPSISVGANLF